VVIGAPALCLPLSGNRSGKAEHFIDNNQQGGFMNTLKYFAIAAVAGLCFTAGASKSAAQVSVNIGVAPECPYGYYDYSPYTCAPYGYYGSEWFTGGVFIGAGPWFHGSSGFKGHVNNHFDTAHGYKGSAPARGEKADTHNSVAHVNNFKGNEVRDGKGHAR
jgi:hypothetical protein